MPVTRGHHARLSPLAQAADLPFQTHVTHVWKLPSQLFLYNTQPFNDEQIRGVDLKLFSISEMAKLSVILTLGCWTYHTEALSVSFDFVALLGPIFLARIPRVVINLHSSSHYINAYRSL